MEQIYEKLYEAFVPPWATPEETAAGEAGEPYFDRLCQRFPPQEAEDIWDAALSAGAAGRAAWVSLPISWTYALVLSLVRYKRGKWRKKAVATSSGPELPQEEVLEEEGLS